ncbi:hypothetical protein OH407_24465, partial [Salmonella enterica]|uniref:hypothetical protein n=1 Tax=Salmonella enterica TaxID=28901 RepID=UPI0022B712E2
CPFYLLSKLQTPLAPFAFASKGFIVFRFSAALAGDIERTRHSIIFRRRIFLQSDFLVIPYIQVGCMDGIY